MKLFLVAAIGIFSSLIVSTGGTHQVCPVCGFGAVCNQGQCVCPANYYGEPDFSCYDPRKWLRCRLKCDPELQTYDRQNVTLSLISPNTFSNVVTQLVGYPAVKCHLKIQTFPARFKGKFYIAGIRFHFKIVFSSTKFIAVWGLIRTHVYKDNDGYVVYVWEIFFWSLENKKYELYAKLYSRGGDKTCKKPYEGCAITFHVCEANFLVATFASCGQRFGIRPYNPFEHIVPGVWSETVHQGFFVPIPHALCNKPSHGVDIGELRKSLKFSTRRQVMTYVSWVQYGNPLYYPGAPIKLKELRVALRQCKVPHVGLFFKSVEFLYENAFLVRCLGVNNLEALIDILLKLIEAFCWRNQNSKTICYKVVYQIKGACHNWEHRPKVKLFLENLCVPLH